MGTWTVEAQKKLFCLKNTEFGHREIIGESNRHEISVPELKLKPSIESLNPNYIFEALSKSPISFVIQRGFHKEEINTNDTRFHELCRKHPQASYVYMHSMSDQVISLGMVLCERNFDDVWELAKISLASESIGFSFEFKFLGFIKDESAPFPIPTSEQFMGGEIYVCQNIEFYISR